MNRIINFTKYEEKLMSTKIFSIIFLNYFRELQSTSKPTQNNKYYCQIIRIGVCESRVFYKFPTAQLSLSTESESMPPA